MAGLSLKAPSAIGTLISFFEITVALQYHGTSDHIMKDFRSREQIGFESRKTRVLSIAQRLGEWGSLAKNN